MLNLRMMCELFLLHALVILINVDDESYESLAVAPAQNSAEMLVLTNELL